MVVGVLNIDTIAVTDNNVRIFTRPLTIPREIRQQALTFRYPSDTTG